MTEPLVSAAWLATNLGPNLRVADVRWYLTEPGRGQSEYLAGHIPGAVYLDIDNDLSGPKGSGPGRHPLPSPAAFAAAMARAGIGPDTHVVTYDASGGAYAARLWWLLRYFGHAHVALLDGGWPAWLAGNYAVETAVPNWGVANFTAQPNPALVVDAAAVEALRHDPHTLLLDARAAERYRGEIEPVDPQAGHIPGAVSAPFSGNLASDGRMLPGGELWARYANLGAAQASQIVCYCGSGVTAAHDIFALHLAGRQDARLYAGSWSDWCSDPARPIATGEQPG